MEFKNNAEKRDLIKNKTVFLYALSLIVISIIIIIVFYTVLFPFISNFEFRYTNPNFNKSIDDYICLGCDDPIDYTIPILLNISLIICIIISIIYKINDFRIKNNQANSIK